MKHLFIKLLFEHYVAFIFGLLLWIDAAITFALLFLLSLFLITHNGFRME